MQLLHHVSYFTVGCYTGDHIKNCEFIQNQMAIMRSRLKNKRGKFSPPLGFDPWSPGTNSQYATNELCLQHLEDIFDFDYNETPHLSSGRMGKGTDTKTGFGVNLNKAYLIFLSTNNLFFIWSNPGGLVFSLCVAQQFARGSHSLHVCSNPLVDLGWRMTVSCQTLWWAACWTTKA